ncbi:MAG TPA: hypothetical protein VGK50_04535 [Coriobacteriia bacterium]|jgi:vacuolar-type H+-ATPase subunit I/STV1
MRYVKGALLLALACAVVLGATACSDQTADANKAIDAANTQIKKYTASGAELEKLMSEAEALPMDAVNAKKGVTLTDQMTAKLEEQRTAAETAKAEISKIKAMKVNEKFKTYADKEIAVTEALLKEDPVAKALIGDLRKIYELVASGKGTQKDVEEIGKRIDVETKQLTDLEAKATALEKEASDYFDSQKLGSSK